MVSPTGQISSIGVDGISVEFSLNHFSIYAALRNTNSSGAPIGAGVEVPLPDILTGAFSHSLPITVIPGRLGLEPRLSLNYRSSNANSWTGTGFSLNPGFITRSTKLGPPSYIDEQDTFYFITDDGTTELVHLIDNLYQAKVESAFTKFFKEPGDYWRAVNKDGTVLLFGDSVDSREVSPKGTFSWQLTRAADTNGNYINYLYLKDQGRSYLTRVEYTGNDRQGVYPANTVEFFLEARPDVSSSYLSSARIGLAKRLKEITVKADSQLIWQYKLEYDCSPDTGRSLLKSVTRYGADGKAFPAREFKYQTAKTK
jgi:hypothetical protein